MKKYFILVLAIVVCLGGFLYMKNNNRTHKGFIVILNGPSASGKTTAQSLLQARSPHSLLKCGIDTFFDALIATPDLEQFQKEGKLEQLDKAGVLIRSVIRDHDQDGNPLVPLTVGPAGIKIIKGMHRAIAAYAEAGNNMVVDYILYDIAWLADLRAVLQGYRVYYVGFKGDLALLESREKARGTSPVGHARSHYATVHQGMLYDLEVDIQDSPEHIVSVINDYINVREKK